MHLLAFSVADSAPNAKNNVILFRWIEKNPVFSRINVSHFRKHDQEHGQPCSFLFFARRTVRQSTVSAQYRARLRPDFPKRAEAQVLSVLKTLSGKFVSI
jgi:hypothetical protein